MSSPRAEALRLARNDDQLVLPKMEGHLPNTPGALGFLAEHKEQHFASLARVSDLLLGQVFDQRPERPPEGLLHVPVQYRMRHAGLQMSPWTRLFFDVSYTFQNTEPTIADDPRYRNAAAFVGMAGYLDAKRHPFLRFQLIGGLHTGLHSTLTFLRNFPNLVKHHDPECGPDDFAQIARHPQSGILIRHLAKGSLQRMRAAQHALATNREERQWEKTKVHLDPEEFILREHRDGSRSLAYKDFVGLHVPTGYVPYADANPLSKPTPIGEVPTRQSKVIGCPVSLLQGRLAELMHWSIDLVESRGLWEKRGLAPKRLHS